MPVNIRLAPPEIRYILENAGAKVVGVEDVFVELSDAPKSDAVSDPRNPA